jgi:hypothetical protein
MSGAQAQQNLAEPRPGEDGYWPPVPRRRKVSNMAFWAVCLVAMALVIIPTLWLVIGICGPRPTTSRAACCSRFWARL